MGLGVCPAHTCPGEAEGASATQVTEARFSNHSVLDAGSGFMGRLAVLGPVPSAG